MGSKERDGGILGRARKEIMVERWKKILEEVTNFYQSFRIGKELNLSDVEDNFFILCLIRDFLRKKGTLPLPSSLIFWVFCFFQDPENDRYLLLRETEKKIENFPSNLLSDDNKREIVLASNLITAYLFGNAAEDSEDRRREKILALIGKIRERRERGEN